MIELAANGNIFELENGADIKYTKQIADIFDLAAVSSSYTNGFIIPKTPKNTKIMKQLGIVGDTSTIPYQKVPATLKHYGFDLFQSGWLQVKETAENYSVSCIDGMIDFFKAIENKTMGKDLDLTNFNHIKDLPSVLDSFTNDYYKYIVADYNGKNLGVFDETEGINIDYLVPGFNMGKLFDLIMTTFGFEYDPAGIEEMNDWYITYPKPPAESGTETLIADLHRDPFVSGADSVGGGYYSAPTNVTPDPIRDWTTETITEGSLINNWKYLVPETTGYTISTDVEMYALYVPIDLNGDPFYSPAYIDVLVNGNPVISFLSSPYQSVAGQTTLPLVQGDVIEFRFQMTPQIIGEYPRRKRLWEFHCNGINLKVYKTNLGDVNLGEAFKDFAIKDFFKEILIRTATVPVINNYTKKITFLTVADRLDFSRAEDWSDKYIRRVNEQYIQPGYAQKNIFSHKHNDENDISQNGYLYVNNQNIDDERTLYDSKTYVPELFYYEFPGGVKTYKYTIWKRETKEATDGVVSIDYKGLNNRFYVMKLKQSPEGEYNFLSEAIPDLEVVTQFPYADVEGTTFEQIILKYNALGGVLNNFRNHQIELALTLNDYYGLDLTKPKYITQEGMYYLLNRLTFDEGKPVVGEFIRINKVLN